MNLLEKQPITCRVCGFNDTCSPCFFTQVDYATRKGLCNTCLANGKGAPKIKLFTASSADYMALHEVTAPSKIAYAHKWGLKYEFREHINVTCWQRVDYWLDALQDCDWLFFMGTDTLIANPEISPLNFIDESYDLIIAKDINCINSDVFMLRNCPAAHTWLRRVRAMENTGVAHEQDAMIACSGMDGLRTKHVRNRLFNSYSPLSHPYHHWSADYVENSIYQPGDFCLHLTALSMDDRIRIATETLSPVSPVDEDGTINIHVSASGIGDAITGLYAACGAAKAGRRVRFHTPQAHWLSRASFPGVEIAANETNAGIDLSAGYNDSLVAGTCRKQWYCDNLARGAGIETISPFAPEIDGTPRAFPVEGEYVLLSPFSAWAGREWFSSHWTRLTHFIEAKGFRVVAVDGPGDGERLRSMLHQTNARWFWGMSPEWVMDAMLGAKAVVGNDSGMSHLAAMLGVKTVAVHAAVKAEQLWGATDVISVMPKEMPCAGCAWQSSGGWVPSCDVTCSALASVSPAQVLNALGLAEAGRNYGQVAEATPPVG